MEIASGIITGPSHDAGHPGVTRGRETDPLGALQDAIRPALLRPPCVVSFSGGLDSSLVLAVAVGLARELGLPAPIPCSWRFTGAPRAEESAWQEQVVAALGLTEWVRLAAHDDLDLVGPVAQRLVRRYGLLHPHNKHLHLPIIELAAGGSVITGVGGDQILAGWRSPRALTASRRIRGGLPPDLRARVQRLRGRHPFPWLRAAFERRALSAHLRERAAEPYRFGHRVTWHAGRRNLLLGCASLVAVAADLDVRLTSPLTDRTFTNALAFTFRGRSSLSRPELIAALSRGQVPAVAFARRDKAHFLEVFLREGTREFVSTWDGTGVDADLVDVAALQRVWSSWPIPGGTAGLVHQAYLSAHPTETRGAPPSQQPTPSNENRSRQ